MSHDNVFSYQVVSFPFSGIGLGRRSNRGVSARKVRVAKLIDFYNHVHVFDGRCDY